MSSGYRVAVAIAEKDVLVEMRSRETGVASLIFAILVPVVFALGVEPTPSTARSLAPGVVWASVVFSALLLAGRTFGAERDRRTLDGLLLAPVDPLVIFLGKWLANAAFLFIVLCISCSTVAILFGVPALVGAALVVGVPAIVGLAALGTLFGLVALAVRARDVFLPVLYVPLAIPVVVAASGATRVLLLRAPAQSIFGVLVSCAVLYMACGALLFSYAVEE